ncbi:SDR family NAD(P)-dependent oxidoreductase [Bdellovibrio sp. HCB337]|uniref:SDR family NAD(P)-dependent oxidoreductase n=1 Tax=Bdellovibrio sp. HCB337 TaxID=3394358 RepID=UPI0039A70EC8
MKVLITGASEGIGRSFAKRLSAEGHTVTAVARNEGRLQELMKELGGGKTHSYVVANLVSPEGVDKIAQLLTSEKFDLLINNAGLATYGEFRTMESAKSDEMMTLNCESLLQLSRAFLQRAQSGDAVINVSSGASFLPMPVSSVYTGSKAFVTAFSEALWYEERKRNIYVMALCPGITMTQFHSRAGGHDKQIPPWLSQTPDQVVDRALKHLKKRSQPVVICGPQRLPILLTRLIPRKWVIFLSGKTLELGMK